jgi:putative membrane protein
VNGNMSPDTPTGTGGRKAAMRALVSVAILCVLAAVLFWADLTDIYPWIKAVHVIAVISWMAGMLYLPRLFVYHSDAEAGSDKSETFKIMERRLLRFIVNPAMIFAWATGLWMAWTGFQFQPGWLHVKLVAVLALSAVHGHLAKAVRLFAEDRNTRSSRYWRIFNEVPTLLMVAIVILVIVKPF